MHTTFLLPSKLQSPYFLNKKASTYFYIFLHPNTTQFFSHIFGGIGCTSITTTSVTTAATTEFLPYSVVSSCTFFS